MIAFGQRDVRRGAGTLPVCESVGQTVFSVPWFKHDRPELIGSMRRRFAKVASHAGRLREMARV
jgi:hypothetical protein